MYVPKTSSKDKHRMKFRSENPFAQICSQDLSQNASKVYDQHRYPHNKVNLNGQISINTNTDVCIISFQLSNFNIYQRRYPHNILLILFYINKIWNLLGVPPFLHKNENFYSLHCKVSPYVISFAIFSHLIWSDLI